MSSPDRPDPTPDSSLDPPEFSVTASPRGDDIAGVDDSDASDASDTLEEHSRTAPRSSATVAETASVDDDTPILVVGGGQIGRLLAHRLSPGRPVHYIDDDATAVDRAARRHDATFVADLTDGRALAAVADDAGATPGTDVVVATPRDATNLLVAQHCRSSLDVSRVLVVVADPRAYDAYPSAFERVCAATALTDAVVSTLSASAAEASD